MLMSFKAHEGPLLFDNKSNMGMDIEQVRITDLLSAEQNPRELTPAYRELLKASLETFGWMNPVIVNRENGRILTGHQRCTVAMLDLNWEWAPVCFVSVKSDKEARAVVCLNDISGNWYFKNRDNMQNQHYAQMSRKNLGSAYKGWVFKDIPFNQSDPDDKAALKAYLGDRIVDFGCGKMTEFPILNKLGIETLGYDPYQKPPKAKKGELFRPKIEHTRDLARKFFADLKTIKKPFTTINQAVLSSIGYRDVRTDVAAILGALTYIGGGRASISMLSTSSQPYETFVYGRVTNSTGKTKGGRLTPMADPARQLYIPDESEENLFVTGVGTSRQIYQKYFTPDDVEELFETFFDHIEIKSLRVMHVVQAQNDTIPDPTFLNGALRRQFGELKIDGEELGLGDLAVQTFEDLIVQSTLRRDIGLDAFDEAA